MSFMDKMKKAGKSVVDAGAKQMLKVSEEVSGHSYSRTQIIPWSGLFQVEEEFVRFRTNGLMKCI